MEKLLVRSFLYPVFNMPHQNLSFQDQFAYRPTGSTTAAISAIIHTAATMLISHRYVHLIAFDMSKAFDTVRHFTLLEKIAALPIDDRVDNGWLII